MKRLLLVLMLASSLACLSACGGSDTGSDPQLDGDSTPSDGDSTDVTETPSVDGDSTDVTETPTVDGDATDTTETPTVDGDVDSSDPFSGLDCTKKTPQCNAWYCNAKKTYDDLYSSCSGTHAGYTAEDCTGLTGCAETFKACIIPYRVSCSGDSVPLELTTKCSSALSTCEKPFLD